MTKTRPLNITTLDSAAHYYAQEFVKGSVPHPTKSGAFIGGRTFVMENFKNFTYKDEFERLVQAVRHILSEEDLKLFDKLAGDMFTPRDDAVFEELLLKKLAINPAGEHVPGAIGTTQIGSRVVGKRVKEVERRGKRRWMGLRKGQLIEMRYFTKNVQWPVYAGELQERAANPDGAPHLTPIPDGAQPFVDEVYATNPRISNEAAIAACDAIVDRLDEGTTAANIRGRSGAQPADPDATETGTLLFTLVMTTPAAFGAAADGTPGGIATADTITDDSSADATGTLGYCRCGATGTGADDHIDGEAGTTGADFNFNTLSIVAGATVSLTSFTVTVPES